MTMKKNLKWLFMLLANIYLKKITNMKIMITNSSNADAYPIVGFTWILAFIDQKDQAKGQTLANLLWWAIHDGQQYCTALDYAPLSTGALTKAEAQIKKINYQGQAYIK